MAHNWVFLPNPFAAVTHPNQGYLPVLEGGPAISSCLLTFKSRSIANQICCLLTFQTGSAFTQGGHSLPAIAIRVGLSMAWIRCESSGTINNNIGSVLALAPPHWQTMYAVFPAFQHRQLPQRPLPLHGQHAGIVVLNHALMQVVKQSLALPFFQPIPCKL